MFNKGLYMFYYCLFWEFSNFYFPIQILELFDYKQFISYVVQMWYKEINNNSELNKKKKVGNCTDYLLIFIDFSCCLY